MHSDYEHIKELKDFLELFGCTWKTYSCDYLYCHGKKVYVSSTSNDHIMGYFYGSLV